MNELLNEYCASLAAVRKLIRRATAKGSADLPQLRSMERDLEWTIEYMTTGYPPKGRSARAISVDPQKVLVWFSTPHPSPLLHVERVRQQILSVLDILSEREKEAYLMIVGEGLSYGEVATLMGVGKSTVASYIDRARRKILERRKYLAVRPAHKGERYISA